jgi:hypothetical protein
MRLEAIAKLIPSTNVGAAGAPMLSIFASNCTSLLSVGQPTRFDFDSMSSVLGG